MKYFKITQDTTPAELKRQYRAAVKKTHPDKGGSKEAFTEMNVEFELAKKGVDEEDEFNSLVNSIDFDEVDAMIKENTELNRIK